MVVNVGSVHVEMNTQLVSTLVQVLYICLHRISSACSVGIGVSVQFAGFEGIYIIILSLSVSTSLLLMSKCLARIDI